MAAALIERLHADDAPRVLDFASGRGRNSAAFRAAGFTVVEVDDAAAASPEPLRDISDWFDAAISTHGLLHGTNDAIASRVHAIAQRLRSGGLLYATFGSSRDERFGQGLRLSDWTFARLDGDERGVVHTFFDRDRLNALLKPYFEAESVEEIGVDDVAGRWAHSTIPLQNAVHWFVMARKR